MSATGFGICGKKNEYSSKTKTGNYVEDRIGMAVAASFANAPRPLIGSTVVRDDFIHPSEMLNSNEPCEKCAQMMVSVEDIRTKNREGISFDLLLGHASNRKQVDELKKERFLTIAAQSFPVTKAMSTAIAQDCARARTFRARKLIADVARERLQEDTLNTIARLQCSRSS